jgi:hypothetical protein
MHKQLKLFPFALALLTWPLIASASDFESPRTAALGGAGHAGPLNTDAIYLNPSYVSLMPIYAVGLNYYTYTGEGTNPSDYHGMGYNASIQDGRSELFQAGVGYTQREDAQLLNFGASKQFVDNLGTGIGGKYVKARDNSGDSFFDTIISSTYIFSKTLQTALIVDNLVESGTAKSRGFYREFTLGSKINLNSLLLIYIDPHVAPDATSAWGYEAGAELPFFTDFYFRGGMFKQSNIPFEAARGNGFGIGAGWIAPKISFDYAYQHVTVPEGAYQHVFEVTLLL